MNFGEIYNRVCFMVWGNSAVPAGTAATLQGQNGMISDIHQKIQFDRNYWFMEASTTIALVDGTPNYNLPTGFKEVMTNGLRARDISTTDYYPALTPMLPGEYDQINRDSDYEGPYPLHYEIRGGQLYLYPTPSQNQTLYMWYYKVLPRPTSASFLTDTDALTEYGYEAICYIVSAEICKILQEYNKAQVFAQGAIDALDTLYTTDVRRRRADIPIRYAGL